MARDTGISRAWISTDIIYMWKEKENTIYREFIFTSFHDALVFVNKIGVLAEEIQHHPDILLYDYKHVRVTLTTHDAEMVTDKDRALAQKIDEII